MSWESERNMGPRCGILMAYIGWSWVIQSLEHAQFRARILRRRSSRGFCRIDEEANELQNPSGGTAGIGGVQWIAYRVSNYILCHSPDLEMPVPNIPYTSISTIPWA